MTNQLPIRNQILLAIIFAWIGLALTPSIASSETTIVSDESEYEQQYQQITESFHRSLNEIAAKCRELNRPALAEATLRWAFPNDPSREFYRVPKPLYSPALPDLNDNVDRSWFNRFTKLKENQANNLFKIATEAIQSGDEAIAYRILHECLALYPAHTGASRLLSFSQSDSFEVDALRYRPNPRRDGDNFLPGSPDSDIGKYESDHFVLFTRVKPEAAKAALKKFEAWHVCWKQIFYPYWATSNWLKRRTEKEVKPLRRSKKFKVVLYSSRLEYLQKLQQSNPGIEVSIGFYSFNDKTSYFYVDELPADKTWIHELTHQWMHEAIPVSTKSTIRSSMWAVEGIAMYMESITDLKTSIAFGGEDAERLNYCRQNYFRRGFFVPMKTLNLMQQEQFVRNPEVKALYSLSGAYTQFLMSQKSCRGDFFKFLKLVHQGKPADRVFETLTDKVSMDSGFKEFLQPKKEQIEKSLLRPESYTVLYLGNSKVDDSVLERLNNATKLQSLDLGNTLVTDAGTTYLAKLNGLRFLSLERTRITNRSLETIGQLIKLEELDLTSTPVDNTGVGELSKLNRLVALWLGGTAVSDGLEKILTELAGLKQLDIRKTKISDSVRSALGNTLKLIE